MYTIYANKCYRVTQGEKGNGVLELPRMPSLRGQHLNKDLKEVKDCCLDICGKSIPGKRRARQSPWGRSVAGVFNMHQCSEPCRDHWEMMGWRVLIWRMMSLNQFIAYKFWIHPFCLFCEIGSMSFKYLFPCQLTLNLRQERSLRRIGILVTRKSGGEICDCCHQPATKKKQ